MPLPSGLDADLALQRLRGLQEVLRAQRANPLRPGMDQVGRLDPAALERGLRDLQIEINKLRYRDVPLRETRVMRVPELPVETPAPKPPPRPGPRLGATGLAVTLGALIAVVAIGIWAISSQEEVLEEAARISDGARPEYVWIGPEPASACEEDVALEHGLSWTGQGWRAPLTLPEPIQGDRTEGPAYEAYLREVLSWSAAMESRVAAAVAEMRDRCGAVTSTEADPLWGTYVGEFTHDDRFPVASEVRITIDRSGIVGSGFVETRIGETCITGVVVFDHPRSTTTWEDLGTPIERSDGRLELRGEVATWGWTGGGCPDAAARPTAQSDVPTAHWDFSAVSFDLVVDPETGALDGELALGSHATALVDAFDAFTAIRV